jgi:hypothetical protein
MNFRFIIVTGLFLVASLFAHSQRLGKDCKRDLPKTIYLAGGVDSISISVAKYFSEENRAFDLEYIDAETLYEKVRDPKAVFVLPLKFTTNEGIDNCSMALVSGSENAKLNRVHEDGIFPWDNELPLIVEVHAQKDWLSGEMSILYISALERLHNLGQEKLQWEIRESLNIFAQGKFDRYLVTANSVVEPLRRDGKFNYVFNKGYMYSSPLELLKNEDVFDPRTIVFTAFQFNSGRVRACFSFDEGLIYFTEDELDPDLGFLMDLKTIKQLFKFSR